MDSGHGDTGTNADAYLQGILRVHMRQSRRRQLNLGGGAYGLRHVIGAMERHVKERHDGIAHELVHDAVVIGHDFAAPPEKPVEDRRHLSGASLTEHCGEPAKVGEESRYFGEAARLPMEVRSDIADVGIL